MANPRRFGPVAVALLLSVPLVSCSWGTPRLIHRHGKAVTGTALPLKVATAEELNAIIARTYNSVQSFQAVVTLSASQGSVHEAKITDYPALPGYIFFRKPDQIHVRANVPYAGSLAFDMVSDGANFRFLLNKNGKTLFQGPNSAPANSANKMENLRPDAFLGSMLIHPFDPATELLMMKDETDEEVAFYRLEFNRRGPNNTVVPGREIWFDREDLNIVRQKVYTDKGDIISDTAYSAWQLFNRVSFPAHIDINRRIDGYGVAIEVNKEKMQMNKELTDAQFELTPGDLEGATVKEIR